MLFLSLFLKEYKLYLSLDRLRIKLYYFFARNHPHSLLLLIENISESIFLSKIYFFINKCIFLLLFYQFTSVITVCDSQGCGMWVPFLVRR
jgi:hypothetical protein